MCHLQVFGRGVKKKPIRIAFGVCGWVSLFNLYLLFKQSFFYIFKQQGIQYGNNGDEYQHADNSEQAAAQRNRCQYPNGRQADGAAYNLGINQISFNLLQNKEQNDERQRLRRAISTPTNTAKGNRKSDMETKNIVPRMTASKHCPVKK